MLKSISSISRFLGLGILTIFGCSHDDNTSQPSEKAIFSGQIVLEIPNAARAKVWFDGQEVGGGASVPATLRLEPGADRLIVAQAPGDRVWTALVSNRSGSFYGTSVADDKLTISARSTAAAFVHLAPQYVAADSTVNAIVADGIWQTSAVDDIAAWLSAHPSTIATSMDADFIGLIDTGIDAAGPMIADEITRVSNANGDLTGSAGEALSTPAELHQFGTWGEGEIAGVWAGNVTVEWNAVDNGTSAELAYKLGGANKYLPDILQLNLISLDYVTAFNTIDKHAFNPTAAGESYPIDLGKDRAWPLDPAKEIGGMFKPRAIYELANPLGLAINALAEFGIPAVGPSVSKPTVKLDHYGTYSVRFFSGAVTSERLDFIRQHPELIPRWQQALYWNMLKATLKLASLVVKLPADQAFFNELLTNLWPICISPEYAIAELDKPGRFDAFATAFTRKALEICVKKLGKDAMNTLVAELGNAVLGTPSKIVNGLATVGITSQLVSLPSLHSIVLTAGSWSDCETNVDCTTDAQCNSSKQCQLNAAPGKAVQLATGQDHTCGLYQGGTIKCWGKNNEGQVGDGTMTDATLPVAVNGLSNVVSLSAERGTCALLGDGTARCWGWYSWYSPPLGDGLSNAITLSTEASSNRLSCAVLANGTVQCWGANDAGQLGNGTITVESKVPVTVSGLSNAQSVSAGSFHACALLLGGTVNCWGSNVLGRLGLGGGISGSSVPVNVGGLANVSQLSIRDGHSFALLADGTLRGWGINGEGQLGNGTKTNAYTPTPVSGVSNAIAVTAGYLHACALFKDGTAQCWGSNASGQLGDGTTIDKNTPVPVTGLTNAISISAGLTHTCALLVDGTAVCWGENANGQLGDGTTVDKYVPTPVVNFP